MIRKRIAVILLILLPAILYGSSPRIIEINTRHLTVIYPSELSSVAADLVCEAESLISSFVNFMQYEPAARITLRVVMPENAGIKPDLPLFSGGINTIEVEAMAGPDSRLILSEILFKKYMELFSGNFEVMPGINDRMLSGLRDYIISGIDDKSIMQLNDYLVNLSDGGLSVRDENLPHFMSCFFWDYIIRTFSKNTVVLSLKDAAYFGDFFNSLCRFTGKDEKWIFKGFRIFLEGYLNPGKTEQYDTIAGLTDKPYNIISHCSSTGGKNLVLIAELDGDYYLFSWQDEKATGSAIKFAREDIKPSSITVSGEGIVVAGYNRFGSVLICFDATGGKILWEKEFPMIYINHIHADTQGAGILFSAEVNGRSSIFLYNRKSVAIIKTENEDVDLIYPSFTNSGQVLYVRRGDVHSIVIFDMRAGSVEEIYRTSNTICGLSEDPAGRILFSESVKGATNIRCIDRSAGTADQLTYGSTSNINPLIIKGRLYFLNYFKGRFRPVYFNSYHK